MTYFVDLQKAESSYIVWCFGFEAGDFEGRPVMWRPGTWAVWRRDGRDGREFVGEVSVEPAFSGHFFVWDVAREMEMRFGWEAGASVGVA